MRLGMLLEVATAGGSLLGGVTAQMLSQATVQKMFGFMSAAVAVIMLSRLQRRNVMLDPSADPGILGGRYHEDESGGVVTYRVKRLPVAIVASFFAGNVSSLLGIGGGVIIGAGAERVVRRAAACGGGDECVHDRRNGERGRGDLLRPRAVDAGAGGSGSARGAARVVGRDAFRPARFVEVAQDHDGGGAADRLRAHVHQRRQMKGGASGTTRDRERDASRLEKVIGVVLRVGVTASSVCLAVGLALSFIPAAEPAALWLLHIGIIVLLATPVARVMVSIVEYVNERDWMFATLTAIVLLELMASAVAALAFNKRL